MNKDERQDPGIMITMREIYDSLQDVSSSIKGVESRLQGLEESHKNQVDLRKEIAEDLKIVDERSRDALDKSDDALKMTNEQAEKSKWLWRATVSAFIMASMTLVVGIMFLGLQMAVDGKEVPGYNNDIGVTEHTDQKGGN